MALPFYQQLLVIIVIICSQHCHAQRGELYGLLDGVIGGTLLDVGFVATLKLHKFKYFNNQQEDTIKIYTHGVIGIGKDTDLARNVGRECPPLSVATSNLEFIAPYWLPVTSGKVTYWLKVNQGKFKNDKDFERMAEEISVRFDQTSASDIDRAVIVTWEKMQNKNNQPRTQIDDNSFQTVIVFLKQQSGKDFKRAYALFVYRVLNYQLVLDNNNAANTPACNSQAYIGLGAVADRFQFRAVMFFPFRRARVAIHSNIDNHNLLGRYAFDLSSDLQPFPPVLNCANSDPDEKVCGVITTNGQPAQSGNRRRRAVGSNDTTTTPRTSTTVTTNIHTTPANSRTTPKPTDNPILIASMTMRAAKDFCLFRKAGQYNHPIFCDLFMYCGVGGSRADVKRCPDRLNYNTVLGVCDWKENLECNFPPQSIVYASSGSTISPQPQVIIHHNPCLLHAWGDIPDPSSCDHYLSCTNTRTIRRPCPASLYFRPTGLNAGYCDYRHNVNCIAGVRNK